MQDKTAIVRSTAEQIMFQLSGRSAITKQALEKVGRMDSGVWMLNTKTLE